VDPQQQQGGVEDQGWQKRYQQEYETKQSNANIAFLTGIPRILPHLAKQAWNEDWMCHEPLRSDKRFYGFAGPLGSNHRPHELFRTNGGKKLADVRERPQIAYMQFMFLWRRQLGWSRCIASQQGRAKDLSRFTPPALL
jgi:hypothetical protein